MINFNDCMNYMQYVDKSTEEQREKQSAAYESTSLSQDVKDKIKSINSKVNLVIFSEGFCPDCTAAIPFAVKMSELNDNIRLHFMPRKGNEKQLEELTGEARIPTIISFDENMNPRGVFIEFPEALKDMMTGKSLDSVKNIVNEYRDGKYSELIEAELAKLVL